VAHAERHGSQVEGRLANSFGKGPPIFTTPDRVTIVLLDLATCCSYAPCTLQPGRNKRPVVLLISSQQYDSIALKDARHGNSVLAIMTMPQRHWGYDCELSAASNSSLLPTDVIRSSRGKRLNRPRPGKVPSFAPTLPLRVQQSEISIAYS